MSLSYDYEELILELEEEIKEGSLCVADIIQILRSKEEIFQSYRPIIEWYYCDEEMKELMSENPEKFTNEMRIKYEKDKEFLEKISVMQFLYEMNKFNNIF